MKILLVEDDQATGEFLTSILTANRYIVDVALDGQSGLELAILWNYDLILLDIELPNLDGISVCRMLRARGDATPTLMLTAKGLNDDVVTGLDAGADDYMIKPCDPTQLLARIRALLRRGTGIQAPTLTWGDLWLDPLSAQVTYQQQPISLGPKEYSLLELFLRNPQRVFNRSAILDNLWEADDFPTESAVTNLIKDLRRKLKLAGMAEDLIETIYGLGYRLKPPPRESVAMPKQLEYPAADRKSHNPEEGLACIRQLEDQFRASLDQRIQMFKATLRSLQLGELTAAQQETAREEAHRLVGGLGLYGYVKGSEIARKLEHLLEKNTLSAATHITQFAQLLQDLQREVVSKTATLSTADPKRIADARSPLVLVIHDDSAFTRELQQEATTKGLDVQIVSSLPTELDALFQKLPMGILLKWSGGSPNSKEIDLLKRLRQRFPRVPILILAEHDTLASRVEASRSGSDIFLTQPIVPGQILEWLDRVGQYAIAQSTPQSLKGTVLAVDDDPVMLDVFANLLHPLGLQVIGLSDSTQFWDKLLQTNPDLVLLDLEMPTFSGIDLCRVVRQDVDYRNIPILIVTAHTDQVNVQQVFDAGADDLIHKPIAEAELVTRVINRIERARLQQQLNRLQQQQTEVLQYQSRVDGLTQIANRRHFDEILEREWHHHQQAQMTLSLILCDVDYFKLYNDRYGHVAGDDCLKQIAQTVQNCINPSTDLAARYGGEEFGVILPNTDLNGALRVAERLRQAIARLEIPHLDSSVAPYVTISLGITGTVPTTNQQIEQLIRTADQALYAAKERGRNTYCLYPL
ncbi:diguanylate cyclase (GGDEF) domain-containing protein [Leptolyngbyaceae cyanobacterium JSC-12]|nr:diguanylate cyclase (GGDEF) domain-containing protein [Leptolyngbyaceae cyanobacterium JSC-12]